MQLYTNTAVNDLIDKYSKHNNFQMIIFDGCLVDNYILYGNNLKTTIIREVPLNEWSSAQSIRSYNNTPHKYDKIIDLWNNEQYNEAEKLFFSK